MQPRDDEWPLRIDITRPDGTLIWRAYWMAGAPKPVISTSPWDRDRHIAGPYRETTYSHQGRYLRCTQRMADGAMRTRERGGSWAYFDPATRQRSA